MAVLLPRGRIERCGAGPGREPVAISKPLDVADVSEDPSGIRTKTLRIMKIVGELEALRMLTDRREALTRRLVQTVDRLHALLAELLPGQAKRDLTTGQAQGDAGECAST